MTAMLESQEENELLTYAEVRDRIDGRVHDRTIARWASQGLLTRVRLGRSVRITAESVERLIASRIREAEATALRAARQHRRK